ncbi:MAG: hypothetical protein C0490_19085 [Marivirga sp.]|nr:hypothetical protein [Marivirga sp.]
MLEKTGHYNVVCNPSSKTVPIELERFKIMKNGLEDPISYHLRNSIGGGSQVELAILTLKSQNETSLRLLEMLP